jgi:dTDP-4-amino-4,6-dideoxygalactose transaminase
MAKLALNGGVPLRSCVFPDWPVYGDSELLSLERVLKSGSWGTLGKEVRKFNQRFAQYQQCDFAISVTNGTVSLEVILRAMGIGFGDEVIIPPYTFIATASAVITSGATPVFADIEPDTYNLDPGKLEEAVTGRTKAIIPVHIGGRPCDMDRIMEIAGKHKLYVIEDAAHAHGSEWKGRRTGSIGHAGSFSFQGSKNLCCGEGGCITTNDKELYEQCWSIHHCGRAARGTQWYEHPVVGTNARMTEWQAAILDAQMNRLDEQIEKRMSNAAYLNSLFSKTGFIGVFPEDAAITRNSYHLYLFRFMSEKCKELPRDKFCNAMSAEGIPCVTGYRCLHKQELFMTDSMRRMTGSKLNYNGIRLENAETAESEGVWLTQNMLLGDKRDMEDIAEAAMKIYMNSNELRQ